MGQEGEEVLAQLAVSLAQSAAIALWRRQDHDHRQIALQARALSLPCALGQRTVPPGENRNTRQQRLHGVTCRFVQN
ncbi:MAG: hypothetical protein JSS43_16470 [Proteobacteria bacterium]|nr:hypothetical protein [Pseudomonadota bacterium]